jgi:hypothetical protein
MILWIDNSVVNAHYVFGVLRRRMYMLSITEFAPEYCLNNDRMQGNYRLDCFIFDIMIKILIIFFLETIYGI